jgi:4-methyl-5(b-hydroxyethyl)-thiazole monophosphate biosynthesis
MVLLHLATGFEEIEAITTIDILRRANIESQMVSVTSKLEVVGVHDITVVADILFEDVLYDDVDMIILPGGMPGSVNLDAHEGLKSKIQEHYNKKKWLAAICAAPLVFGRMGLLEGKEAICYPSFEPELRGATIVDDIVAVSGNIITGKGAGVTMDFALEIVKQLKGEEMARQIAIALLKPKC